MDSMELPDHHEDDHSQPAPPGGGPERLSHRPAFPAESEMLLKKAFESDTNTGIELLFRWYYRPLCSHVVRYVSSKEIAEDIVSEVFYKFHKDGVFATVETSFRNYLFSAVRYSAFDYARREMKRNTSLEYAEYVTLQPEHQPDHITQYEDLYNDVQNAINTLPQKQRRVYLMHRYEGKKYSEIAAELGISYRTVESQMYSAMQELRRIIKAKWLFTLLALFH
ncbi:RNA polymerase sigma-70 factor [Dyadobacter sp. 22481]|uniref:RNA polymerase sigma-70 factor n=1 Tax=Dyadobacter sp. 22481 TaxID=3453926 RepID=UPI003F84AE0A